MARSADFKTGITFGSTLPVKSTAMKIDGGQDFKMNTDAAKMGKDKGYPMGGIKTTDAKALSAQFTPKVTRPSPVAPKVTVPKFSSGGAKVGGMIGWGSGGGMGMARVD